jgi:hypothetical protein
VIRQRIPGARLIAPPTATLERAYFTSSLMKPTRATKLGLSRRTVNAHLRAAFGLLGVENRTSAVLEICQHLAVEAAFAN